MKFQPAEDNEAYFERLVSEDGKIELGVYPVMFGYRVRAGFTTNEWSEIDWCGGDDQGQVEMLYSFAKNILEKQGDFKGMPMCSKIKPFYNDEEFSKYLFAAASSPLEIIHIKPISEYRDKLMKRL
jgi:hypothetical protein